MKRFKIVKIIGCGFIIAGLVLILGSLVINISQQAVRKAVIAEFKEQINRSADSEAGANKGEQPSGSEVTIGAEVQGEESPSEPLEGDILCILRIPSIESESPVREGVSGGILADSLGHEPGTAMVGEPGNCVIAGHRNYTFGQFFNRLNEVKIGDNIYVDTATETYSYVVTDIKVVEPEDLSVLESTVTETLTLYTCTPLYLATHRLVIVAERGN